MQRGLTQEELANRCELSKGFISLVERNLTSPSIATLTDMLESLGTDLKTFFGEAEDEKIVFGEKDIFVKEDAEGIRGRIKWLGAEEPDGANFGGTWSVRRDRRGRSPRGRGIWICAFRNSAGDSGGAVCAGTQGRKLLFQANGAPQAGQRGETTLPFAVGVHAAIILTGGVSRHGAGYASD